MINKEKDRLQVLKNYLEKLFEKKQENDYDNFFYTMILDYEYIEDNPTYEGFVEYIHSFIDKELYCVGFDIAVHEKHKN